MMPRWISEVPAAIVVPTLVVLSRYGRRLE